MNRLFAPWQRRKPWALAALLATATVVPAAAQWYAVPPQPADTSRIFSYVEQLPALPGGGGNLALVKTVQRQVQLPAEVREGRTEGRVYVRVVVGVSGVARQATVIQKLSPACDMAALAAVQRLPRLVPGRSNGQPVATALTVPVVFFSPRHVFASSEVAQAPKFPGGNAGLEKYLDKNRQTPAEVALRDLRGYTTVRFVLRADGRIGATEVTRPLCAACDDEALRLVRALPRWEPALGYDDQPVAMQQSINVAFSPPPLPPGTAAPTPERQVFSYAQPMPTLPGAADNTAIGKALLELVQLPERILGGQMQVSFVVEPDGRVTRPAIVQSFDSQLNEAVLTAALHLPRFEPGQQNGRSVAVRLTVPLTVEIH